MRSVLLDTNTLLLYLVGNINPQNVGRKRLEKFDVSDLKRLNTELECFDTHVSTPNVLTEVSNLLGSGKQQLASGATKAFRGYCSFVSEFYEPSARAVANDSFLSLGLADSVILQMASDNVTVFTVDHELYGRLHSKGLDAVNLLHYKTPTYE